MAMSAVLGSNMQYLRKVVCVELYFHDDKDVCLYF